MFTFSGEDDSLATLHLEGRHASAVTAPFHYGAASALQRQAHVVLRKRRGRGL